MIFKLTPKMKQNSNFLNLNTNETINSHIFISKFHSSVCLLSDNDLKRRIGVLNNETLIEKKEAIKLAKEFEQQMLNSEEKKLNFETGVKVKIDQVKTMRNDKVEVDKS